MQHSDYRKAPTAQNPLEKHRPQQEFMLKYDCFRRSSAVEQLTVNQLVVGSIPTAGANLLPNSQTVFLSDTAPREFAIEKELDIYSASC